MASGLAGAMIVSITLIKLPKTNGVPRGPNILTNYFGMILVAVFSMIISFLNGEMMTAMITPVILGMLFNTWIWFFAPRYMFDNDSSDKESSSVEGNEKEKKKEKGKKKKRKNV